LQGTKGKAIASPLPLNAKTDSRELTGALRPDFPMFSLSYLGAAVPHHQATAREEAAHFRLGKIVSMPIPLHGCRSNSGSSDKEIESVNGRLASLERLLESIVNKHSATSSNASPPASSGGPTLSTPRDSQLVFRDVDYEGDSSFYAQSKSLSQVIEKGLKTASEADGESIGDVAAAVATLRDFLNEKDRSLDSAAPPQSTLRAVVDYPELSNLTLPPMQRVLALLRYARSMIALYLQIFMLTRYSTPTEIHQRYSQHVCR
jgi:hypothetical protein